MSTYRNGNYLVNIYPEGDKFFTALRRGEEFSPEFPDAIDIKLTNRCSRGCPYCHESSLPDGLHGNLDELRKILEYLPEVPIELSFGGGNILEMNPSQLDTFFRWCKQRGHRVGITLNYSDFCRIIDPIKTLNFMSEVDSVGISLDSKVISEYKNKGSSFIESLNGELMFFNSYYKNPPLLVYHLILGTFPLQFFLDFLKNNSLPVTGNSDPNVDLTKRVLLLGYKSKGRGKDWKGANLKDTYFEDIKKVILREGRELLSGKNVLSFDNLAISQLQFRSSFTTEAWEELYLGDDFTHSMYIDLPGRCYGPSSTSNERISFDNQVYGKNIVSYFKNEHN